jgi:hypothetical protein
MVKLWSINRILRYTGFRLIIGFNQWCTDCQKEPEPTLIGLKFYGWKFLKEGGQ